MNDEELPMMKLIDATTLLLAAIGICLLNVAPAFSQDVDYARDSVYLGVSAIGGSYTDIDEGNDENFSFDVDEDATAGFKTYIGVRFHPRFAVEEQIEVLRKADIKVDGGGKSGDFDSWSLTTNFKAFLLTGRVQPFVLAGLGVMRVEFNDTIGMGISRSGTGFVSRYGAGVDFFVTEHVVVSVGTDYVLPTGDVDDFDYVSYGGGIRYVFW